MVEKTSWLKLSSPLNIDRHYNWCRKLNIITMTIVNDIKEQSLPDDTPGGVSNYLSIAGSVDLDLI